MTFGRLFLPGYALAHGYQLRVSLSGFFCTGSELLEMARKKLTLPLHPRDVNFIKPARFKDHVTIAELSRITGKEISWLRKLERDERIPVAARVKWGKLKVRLWSPEQVDEIVLILSKMRPGRPRKDES